MTTIDAVTATSPHSPGASPYLEAIQRAERLGLLERYKSDLERCGWKEMLNNSPATIEVCYLFTLAVDPHLHDRVAGFLSSKKEGWFASVPPELLIHILPRLTNELLREVVCVKEQRFALMLAVMSSSLPVRDRQTLLDRLFESLSEEEKEEILFYAYNSCSKLDLVILSEGCLPEVRQERSIKMLKRHFLTPSIHFQDRQQFIDKLLPDLTAELLPRELFYRLSQALPKETLPFLFTHFGKELCEKEYDEYLETHSEGGVFQRVQKNGSPQLKDACTRGIVREEADKKVVELLSGSKLPHIRDIERAHMWMGLGEIDDFFNKRRPLSVKERHDPERLIELGAQLLDQMVDNLLVLYEGELHHVEPGLRHLYQVACETNTIYPMIRRFVAICPRNRTTATLNLFASCCFKNNSKGFMDLISEALGPDKIASMAALLVAYYKRAPYYYLVDLDTLCWTELFVKDDDEVAALAKKLVELMQDDFINLFRFHLQTNDWMIASLSRSDRAFCQELFFRCIASLCKSDKEASSKVSLLHNLCQIYTSAGFRFSELLTSEEVAKIKVWYTKEAAIQGVGVSRVAWYVLWLMIPEQFDALLIQKIEEIFSTEKKHPLASFNKLVEEQAKIGTSEADLRKLIDAHPTTRDALVRAMRANIEDAIDKRCFSLLCHYVKDWDDLLHTWVKEDIPLKKYRHARVMDALKEVGAVSSAFKIG